MTTYKLTPVPPTPQVRGEPDHGVEGLHILDLHGADPALPRPHQVPSTSLPGPSHTQSPVLKVLKTILEVLKSKRRVNTTYGGLPWWGGANPSCVYLVEGSAS